MNYLTIKFKKIVIQFKSGLEKSTKVGLTGLFFIPQNLQEKSQNALEITSLNLGRFSHKWIESFFLKKKTNSV